MMGAQRCDPTQTQGGLLRRVGDAATHNDNEGI